MGFWQPLFFWIFAVGAVLSSIAVLLFRNPLYSALSLIVDFGFFAGLYVLLSGHAIAVVQILVYTGAIMVLFVFIIMLLNLGEDELGQRQFSLHHIFAVVAGVGIFGMISVSILQIVDFEKVNRDRAEAQATSEDGKLMVATESKIDGLYAQLSEPKLQQLYREQVNGWVRGESTPAAGKYRPFEPRDKFEVPPALHADETKGATRKDEGMFGTLEPLSILLVNRFVVPFELTALLLLAAIVGAVIIAKKRL
jgi:NADH-quinone oxidoreductase subunit J